jgi:hypothetical protein
LKCGHYPHNSGKRKRADLLPHKKPEASATGWFCVVQRGALPTLSYPFGALASLTILVFSFPSFFI